MRGAVVVALAAACSGSSKSSGDGAAGGAAPDPRFKWVGAYSSYATGVQYVGGNGVDFTSTTDVYSPAAVGSGGEALVFDFTPPATLAFTSAFAELSATLDVAATGEVVTSLAFTGSNYVTTSQSASSTMSSKALTAATIEDVVTSVEDASQMNEVTTALGFGGASTTILTYYDSSSPNTYHSVVMTGELATVDSMASQLAGMGYVITAIGTVDNGVTYAVVGTSIAGSATTHDAMTVTYAVGGSATALADAQTQGYAVVGGYFSDPLTAVFVLER